MRTVRSALLGGLAGAALAYGGSALLGHRGEPPRSGSAPTAAPRPVPVAEVPPLQAVSPAPGGGFDLAPIATRLEEVVARLAVLEAKVDRALAPPQRSAAIPPPVAIDADTLQQALMEIDRRRLEAMSDAALRQHAWRTAKAGGDYESAARALQLVVERASTPMARAAALTDLGMLQRLHGGDEGLSASVRSLRAVVDAHGVDSAPGVTASLEMIWSLSGQQDHAGALQCAQAVAGSRAASAEQRLDARWAAAIMTQNLGDRVGARAAYEQLLREIDGRPDQAKRAGEIRRRLEAL